MPRPKRGGAAAKRRGRPTATIAQLPAGQRQNPYPPVEIISADQVEAIHHASLDVLQRIGVNFLLDEAREMLAAAGAEIDGQRVRFDRAMVAQHIKSVPPIFTLHGRNPAWQRRFGKNYINFGTVASPPHVTDLDRGRRTGNFEDYCQLLRLGQALNICDIVSGYPVEAVDIAPAVRHLETLRAAAKLTDKNLFGYSLGRQRIRDAIEIARLARGIDHDTLRREPSMFTVVNANSPLQYDGPMLIGVIECARMNQPVVFTPFTLAGAMAPITVAGALVQQNAEALAGITFAQIVNPGAPVVYGSFTSNVDMKSGAPAFGTPEYVKATLISGQLARRYNFPFRASNANASNAPDVQSAYESMMSIWPCVQAHCNVVMHGLGWLEGGLTASYEKMVIDAELLQMMAAFLEPIDISPEAFGIDAMEEVGPGGHFFGSAHTLARYETAFYAPLISDWRNFETWAEAGAVDATARAQQTYKQLLAEYQQPAMDPAAEEALDDFVDRRIAEGGAVGE